MSTSLKLKMGGALAVLSSLLEYPRTDFAGILASVMGELKSPFPESHRQLCEFQIKISALSLEQLEEIYTRTFDLAPICTPYLSSYIYGDENYERGALMSRLTERYQECDFDMKAELPDHIALILRFAAHCEKTELSELIEFCLFKPMSTMLDTLKEADNPYYFVLASVQAIIETEHKGVLS